MSKGQSMAAGDSAALYRAIGNCDDNSGLIDIAVVDGIDVRRD